MILSVRNTGDSRSQIASMRSMASASGVMVAGSSGSGTMSENAVTMRAPVRARENFDWDHGSVPLMIIEEQGFRRHVMAGVVDNARTSLAEDGR
jgi:hypothetical protein